MQAHSAQAAHDPRANDEREKERRDGGARRAERYPLEQSQKSEMRQSYEWN
jgi:hypothetical protein